MASPAYPVIVTGVAFAKAVYAAGGGPPELDEPPQPVSRQLIKTAAETPDDRRCCRRPTLRVFAPQISKLVLLRGREQVLDAHQ
jgi:hypothetical protein